MEWHKLWPGKLTVSSRGVIAVVTNRSKKRNYRFSTIAMSTQKVVAAVDEKGKLIVVEYLKNQARRLPFRQCAALAVIGNVVLGASCDRLRSALLCSEDGHLSVLVAGNATGHQQQIFQLEAQDTLLLSASNDCARLWHLSEGPKRSLRRIAQYRPNGEEHTKIIAVRFLNQEIVLLMTHKVLCAFMARTGQILDTTSTQATTPLRCLACCADIKIIDNSNTLRCWQFKDNQLISSQDNYVVEQQQIRALDIIADELLCLSDDGRLVVYSGDDTYYEIARASVVTGMAVQLDALCALVTSSGDLILIDLGVARKRATQVPKDHLEFVAIGEPQVRPEVEEVLEEDRPAVVYPAAIEEVKEEKEPAHAAMHRLDRVSAASFLNTKRLRYLLASNQSYPVKYRSLAWRIVLNLPENDMGFYALLNETESKHFDIEMPKLKCSKEGRALNKVVRALISWCPALNSVPWLASAVYPVLKVFDCRDLTSCFEVMVLLLGKFAKGWFMCWPEMPLQLLECAEVALRRVLMCYVAAEDAEIIRSRLTLKATSKHALQGWYWPMLRTLMSEVLPTENWFEFMDRVLSAGPKRGGRMLMLAPIALAISDVRGLRECQSREDLIDWMRRPARDPAGALRFLRRLSAAAQTDTVLAASADTLPTPDQESSELAVVAEEAYACAEAFPFPLPKSEYPYLSAYPRDSVERAARDRERIAQEAERIREEAASEEGVIKAAREAERAARALAAAEIAGALAEEKAVSKLKLAAERRERLLAEQRASELTSRLETAAKAEARAVQAMKARARLRQATAERLELEAEAADRSTQALATHLEARERVARLERRAVQRIESLRTDAELSELARDLDPYSRQSRTASDLVQQSRDDLENLRAHLQRAFDDDETKETGSQSEHSPPRQEQETGHTFRDFATEINQEELDRGGSVTPPITTTAEVATQGSIDFDNLDRFISRARSVLDQATAMDGSLSSPPPATTLTFSPPPEDETPSGGAAEEVLIPPLASEE